MEIVVLLIILELMLSIGPIISQTVNKTLWEDQCFSKYSCNGRADIHVSSLSPCYCDSWCSFYGDCCVDSLYRQKNLLKKQHSLCVYPEESSYAGVYIVTKCSNHWLGNSRLKIKKLCEDPGGNVDDPMLYIKVTNSKSGVTYNNFFCSICNFDASGLISWNVTLRFKDKQFLRWNPDYIVNNMFHVSNELWAVCDSEGECYEFQISDVIPDQVKVLVRSCHPDLISACPSNWTDIDIRTKCDSYTGYAYTDSSVYRNLHCAICNGVQRNEISCQDKRILFDSILSRNFNSFPYLMDFTLSCGEDVGKTNKCSEDEVFDQISKRCRSSGCALLGYSEREGRCVKD